MAILLSQVGNIKNLSAAPVSIGAYVATTEKLVQAAFRLAGLNAAEATITAWLEIEGPTSLERYVLTEAKSAAGDVKYGSGWPAKYVAAGETMRIKVASSNASDTMITTTARFIDAADFQGVRDAMRLAPTEGVEAAANSIDDQIADAAAAVAAIETPAITPLQATLASNRYTLISGESFQIPVAQHETVSWTWTVVDAEASAVDLSGELVRLVIHERDGTVLHALDTVAGGVTVGGASNNEVTVALGPTQTAATGLYHAKLWHAVDDGIATGSLIASGTIAVKLAPISRP